LAAELAVRGASAPSTGYSITDLGSFGLESDGYGITHALLFTSN